MPVRPDPPDRSGLPLPPASASAPAPAPGAAPAPRSAGLPAQARNFVLEFTRRAVALRLPQTAASLTLLSLLALKVVPLVIALPWLWQGRVRAYQAWSMGILLYLCEGVVRDMSDPGAGRALGWIETALACLAFGAILAYVRARRAPRA